MQVLVLGVRMSGDPCHSPMWGLEWETESISTATSENSLSFSISLRAMNNDTMSGKEKQQYLGYIPKRECPIKHVNLQAVRNYAIGEISHALICHICFLSTPNGILI